MLSKRNRVKEKAKKLKEELEKNGIQLTAERVFYKSAQSIVNTINTERGISPSHVALSVLKAQRVTTYLEKANLGVSIHKSDIQECVSSNTLFILGSGSSINDIPEKKWEKIRKNDSIGLNRWPVHSHKPTLLVFELPWANNIGYTKEYLNLLRNTKNRYKSVPKIMKGVSFSSLKHVRFKLVPDFLFGNLLLASDTGFGSIVDWNSRPETNRELLSYLFSNGFFKTGYLGTQYKKRGSISFTLHLAKALGYKNIVLCGVDMDDRGYFFTADDKYDNKSIPMHDKSNLQQGSIHKTVDPEYGQITLDKVILDMNNIVLKKSNVKLFVENESSLLYPSLPIYDWR
jgi:hypothetical protein